MDSVQRNRRKTTTSRRLINEPWKVKIRMFDYAFQPIVNIHTGVCFGYEAFLRNYKRAGFDSIQQILDSAYEADMLFQVEEALFCKALQKFCEIPEEHQGKLFFNLDSRVLNSYRFITEGESRPLESCRVKPKSVCFEISERHRYYVSRGIEPLQIYRRNGFDISIDHAGKGISELQLLYHFSPDFLKIDRISAMNSEMMLKASMMRRPGNRDISLPVTEKALRKI